MSDKNNPDGPSVFLGVVVTVLLGGLMLALGVTSYSCGVRAGCLDAAKLARTGNAEKVAGIIQGYGCAPTGR